MSPSSFNQILYRSVCRIVTKILLAGQRMWLDGDDYMKVKCFFFWEISFISLYWSITPHKDGPLPSVLQEVTVPVIKNDICEGMYRAAGYIEHIPHIFICAGWKKGGYDSCEGQCHLWKFKILTAND